MPRAKPPSSSPNAAAAALGVGITPDKWTPTGMIHAMTNRFLQLAKLSEDERERGNIRKHRLYQAGMVELAQIIATYHQDRGEADLHGRWDRRTKQALSIAYRRDNPVPSSMGVDPPPEETA